MARTSMAALIGRVRMMIGDPAGGKQQFDDDTLQTYLDDHVTVVRYARLRAVPTYASGGGAVQWLDFYAGQGDFEANEQLVDASYTILTPATSDQVIGHWTFSTSTVPAVRLSGRCYDRFAAAADALEAWAGLLSRAFDFSTDGQSFRRSQTAPALLRLAEQYRAKQLPGTAHMTRSDLLGDQGGGLGPVLPFPASPSAGEQTGVGLGGWTVG